MDQELNRKLRKMLEENPTLSFEITYGVGSGLFYCDVVDLRSPDDLIASGVGNDPQSALADTIKRT